MSHPKGKKAFAVNTAQDKLITKAKLDSEKKAILDQCHKEVQDWADNKRDILVRHHERDSGTMKRQHEKDRSELESEIKRYKVMCPHL
jgi:hypothetical protein